jgi:multiple sugar transport system permease protein
VTAADLPRVSRAPSAPSSGSLHRDVLRRRLFPYVMLLPALLVTVGVVIYPMAYSLYISFTRYNLLRAKTTSQFVPAQMLDNYIRLGSDDVFWKSVVNTLVFMTVTVNLEVFLGFGLALLMARMARALGTARTLLMIPMMFAPVLVGFQFAWFFNATVGLVNNALLSLGLINQPVAWLINEPTGMIGLMLATIWMNVPVVTIVLLAGRLSVSQELYEAAEVDGASSWQRLRAITVPQMRTFILIAMTLLSLDIARAYDIVRMMTDGGPAHRTELLWTYAGRLAIRDSQFGFASAVSMVGVVIGIVFTLYLFRGMMRAREEVG